MTGIVVEEAAEADIPQILAIAEALALQDKAPERGFLGSGFSKADYEAFLREAQHTEKRVVFSVARLAKDAKCVGFLLGYNEAHVRRPFGKRFEWPNGGTERSIVELLSPWTYPLLGVRKVGSFTAILRSLKARNFKAILKFKSIFKFKKTTFFVIKQIPVDPESMHRGVAQELYSELFREARGDYFFAAIITNPENTRSESFHRGQGFVPIMQCFSGSKLGGSKRDYINRVWLKPARPMVVPTSGSLASDADRRVSGPAQDQDQKKIEHKRAEAARTGSDLNNLWKTNFEHAQKLYLHEDSLNWSKMRTLAAVATALVAGVGYFASSGHTDRTFFVPFILCGTAILLLISVTLESGIYFMHSHKQVLRILEAQMRLAFPDFVPLLWKVPARSSTTLIIHVGLYLLLLAWIIYLLWQAYVAVFGGAAHNSDALMEHLPLALI